MVVTRGAIVTPRGQSSLLGANFTHGVESSPLGAKYKTGLLDPVAERNEKGLVSTRWRHI
jgi:hypothetical protein